MISQAFHAGALATGVAVLLGYLGVGTARADRPAPSNQVKPPDLVKLITCGAPMKEYQAFAQDFAQHPERSGSWGWKEVAPAKGLLKVYSLATPISVFGATATRIAFSGSSIVAFVARPAPALAKKLGLEPVFRGPTSAIFGKTVHASQEVDKASGMTISEKISLSVSTSPDFAGVTLAGCSYALDVN
jgi:hypothetical protein